MRFTRRGLQVCLRVLWLLDAGLQYQPYMFTRAFAKDVIASTAAGQPGWVAGPVTWAADLTGAHPLVWNAAFATVQLLLGVGLLWPRTVRVALATSVAWSLGVWWLGEGLGGVASGHAMLLTGGPGAVLLYALLAVLAWPRTGVGRGESLPVGAVWAWVGVWVFGVVFQLLPGQNTAADVSGALADTADSAPGALGSAGHALARGVGHHSWAWLLLVVLMGAVGVLALRPGAARAASVVLGCLLAAGFWAFGQTFGQLASGQATDPNTGPLLILLGLAAAAATPSARHANVLPLPRRSAEQKAA